MFMFGSCVNSHFLLDCFAFVLNFCETDERLASYNAVFGYVDKTGKEKK